MSGQQDPFGPPGAVYMKNGVWVDASGTPVDVPTDWVDPLAEEQAPPPPPAASDGFDPYAPNPKDAPPGPNPPSQPDRNT